MTRKKASTDFEKFPKKVYVAGNEIEVLVGNDYIGNDDDWGCFDEDHNVIEINPVAFDMNLQWDILKHEMIHAAFRYSGLFYHTMKENMMVEESIVRCIEKILLPAIEKLK